MSSHAALYCMMSSYADRVSPDRVSLFASTPHSPPVSSSSLLGGLQTWPMHGASYSNTRHLPFSVHGVNAGFMETLESFSAVLLPQPMQQTSYVGVVDETHFFAIGRTSASITSPEVSLHPTGNGFGIGGADTVILKVNRFTGVLEMSVTIGLTTGRLSATMRGPLFAYQDHLYATSGLQNWVWKLRKFDLSLEWEFQLPHWRINEPRMEFGLSHPIYYTMEPMVIPPRSPQKDASIVIVPTSAGASYQSHAFQDAGGGEASPGVPNARAVNNIERLVQFHYGVGYVFGLEDNGDHAKLKYEFSGAPIRLEEGDFVPDESFAQNETKVKIWDIVQDELMFVDGDPSTGVPTSTGSFVYPTEIIEAPGHPEVTNSGYLTFRHGEVFNSSRHYLLMNVTSSIGQHLEDVLVPGTYLLNMPIIKTVYKRTDLTTHRLTHGEAWGLNYYGGSFYGSSCFDLSTGVLYVPSGNGYSFPVSDQLAARAMNNLDTAMNYEDVHANFLSQQAKAHSMYIGGDTETAYQLSRASIAFWKDLEMRRRSIRSTRSPRYQRFFHGSVTALNAYSGSLEWGFPIIGHDQKDANIVSGSVLGVYQEDGSNHDITSVAITVVAAGKRLVAAGKMAIGIYDLDNADTGFTPSVPADFNADAGLTAMRYPELRVDLLMYQELQNFGGLVLHDGTYFILRHMLGKMTVAGAGVLPYAPVDGGSPLVPMLGMGPVVLWACDISTGTVKWLRTISLDVSLPQTSLFELMSRGIGAHFGGVVGYGNSLVVGTQSGRYLIIDMATGLDRQTISTAGSAVSCGPIVNAQLFHLGGTAGRLGNIDNYAFYAEIFTVLGA